LQAASVTARPGAHTSTLLHSVRQVELLVLAQSFSEVKVASGTQVCHLVVAEPVSVDRPLGLALFIGRCDIEGPSLAGNRQQGLSVKLINTETGVKTTPSCDGSADREHTCGFVSLVHRVCRVKDVCVRVAPHTHAHGLLVAFEESAEAFLILVRALIRDVAHQNCSVVHGLRLRKCLL
jgi:hypothetical protein